MVRVVEITLEGLKGLESELALRLTERLVGVGGMALPKSGSVAVDLSWTPHEIGAPELLKMVRSVLEELGVADGCEIVLEEDRLVVRVRDREAVLEGLRRAGALRGSRVERTLHQCPHCGYVTPYEELLREHLKIHYLGLAG